MAGRAGRSTATSRGRSAPKASGRSSTRNTKKPGANARSGWLSEAFEGYGDDVAGTLLIGAAIICGASVTLINFFWGVGQAV
mgnify:CR=1 FL=1